MFVGRWILTDGTPWRRRTTLFLFVMVEFFRDSSHSPSKPGAADRIVQLDAQAFLERLSFV
jgi:hypothetical protein